MTCEGATSSLFAKTEPSDASDVCPACEASKVKPSGLYHLYCVGCCTRLVLSTHPNKRHAAVMLAAIDRFPGNPGRAVVLESVRQALMKRPSVPMR